MKIYKSTKEQNHQWAYIYLGLAGAMLIMGFWQNQFLWFIFSIIMTGLAGFRLYGLGRKLKEMVHDTVTWPFINIGKRKSLSSESF
jgi:hypothetical protein